MAAGHFCHVLQMVIVDDLENIGIAIGVFPVAPPSKSRKRVQFVDDDQGRDGSDTLFAHAAVHRHARGRVKFDGPETHTQALSDLGVIRQQLGLPGSRMIRAGMDDLQLVAA